jgi:ribosomal protein L22
MVNQKVQDALKIFQDTKNRENEKTQKQINDLSEVIQRGPQQTPKWNKGHYKNRAI